MNDWLYEMNEPFSNDQLYLDVGLPGYTERYNAPHQASMLPGLPSSNVFMLLIAAGVTGYAYRRYQQKKLNIDDEF